MSASEHEVGVVLAECLSVMTQIFQACGEAKERIRRSEADVAELTFTCLEMRRFGPPIGQAALFDELFSGATAALDKLQDDLNDVIHTHTALEALKQRNLEIFRTLVSTRTRGAQTLTVLEDESGHLSLIVAQPPSAEASQVPIPTPPPVED